MLRSPNHRLPVRLRRALTIVVLALCAAFILSLLSGISSALVHQLPHSFNPASLVPTAVTRFFERRNPPAKSVEATPLSPPAPFFANTTSNYIGTSTGNLSTTTNWSLGHVPIVSEDAVFTATGGIRHLDASSLTVGSFNVTAASGLFRIRNH